MHNPKKSEKLKVVFSGMGGNSYLSRELEPIIKKCGMELVIISEWDDATVKWNLNTYRDDIANCDIAICPQNIALQPAKSSVKLVNCLSLGMPTICSPLPAYLEIVNHNQNALVASTLEEWEKCFNQLKDYSERLRLSKAAQESVKDYSPRMIGQRWVDLLSRNQIFEKKKVAFINNTLNPKYLSYGDYWLDAFRTHHQVDEFKYEEIEKLPKGYDLYFFIEKRYDPEKISLDIGPTVLYTQEDQDLNTLPHFDFIFSSDFNRTELWKRRGFINIFHLPNTHDSKAVKTIFKIIKQDLTNFRKEHNQKLHTAHINSFYELQLPEVRWQNIPNGRDWEHIKYTLKHSKPESKILDIGSADGWLSLFLAKEGFKVSALEIVPRGLDWTRQQCDRLGLKIDLREGFFEDVLKIFPNEKFDQILVYETLEHLSYRDVRKYLLDLEKLLSPDGIILMSLPKQDLRENDEHLYSPTEYKLQQIYNGKPNLEIEWCELPNHPIPGHWFIKYGNRLSNKKTDIIIPSYKNLPYLKLTIESIRKNTTNYNLIVVNSGEDENVRHYLQQQKDIILLDTKERRSFSQNINIGLKYSTNDVVILNNDVIVGKNWLVELQTSPFHITNPFSNCDAGWIHNYIDVVGGVSLHPNMIIEDVNVDALLDTSSLHKEIITRDWVAFYATYIKREVIDQVGLLDENFLNGGEDYDFCRRAKKLGFTAGHVFSSFVFHFGGKTRKVSENENYVQHHKEDDHNNQFMRHKDRETVCIYTGPAWEAWTSKNINTTGIGGSETCAALLAEQFAKQGMRSILVGDCLGQEGFINQVEYVDWRNFDKFKETNYIDYFISSRTTLPLGHRIKNGKNFVWVHDIWLQEITHADKVNKFICLSPWHIDFFSQHHSISKGRIYTQPNGLELSRYENCNVEKDPYKLIYSSSPDRGLAILLQHFKELKKYFPKLTLHVFYGFDNWEKAIKQRGSPDEIQHMNLIKDLMKQDGVIYRGRVSQIELAKEQLSSTLWVYPTWFTETFCITAIEGMYAGAVPVTTRVAALETTIPENCGIKESDTNKFINIVTDLLKHPEKLDSYRKNGKEYVKNYYSWDKVVQNWLKMFKEVN